MSEPASRAEVEAAFGAPIRSWSVGAIRDDAVAGATKGLYRVSADGRSLILKLLTSRPRGHHRWRSSLEPDHPYYWKREALVLRSPLMQMLGDELRAPRVFGVFDRGEHDVALWLEDVRGTPATAWSLERYGRAARHLARAQGRLISDLPSEPWWSSGWLREYLVRHTPVLPHGATNAVARSIPPDMIAASMKLWDERDWFLVMLDSLPATLCHLDAWTLNLFADEQDRTVLIDWAYSGRGSLCEDSGNIFADAFFDGFVAPAHVEEMERLIYAGFQAGLRDVQVKIDADLLRMGFAAATAIKYVWMIPHMFAWAEDPAADLHEVAIVLERRLPVMVRLFEFAEEARTLARAHGLRS